MKNNKGFSLTELLIVVTIMAVLVGIMAPQLVKYIEKSKVTTDLDFLSKIESAMVYGITEAEIYEDPASRADIDAMIAGYMKLEDLNPSSLLYAEVCDTLGLPDLQFSTYTKHIQSYHGSNCHIYMTYNRDIKNPIKIWINDTDIEAKRHPYQATSITDANFEKCVHIN